jgi:FkbM family methyltransferase
MHRGDDTDFYLRKGFSVLAVEAAPDLVRSGQRRFANAIDAGRLENVPVAVANFVGEIDFYLSDEDLWASTRADMADRGHGAVHKKITVPCTTLDRLLAGYPIPYFIKIDVEGQDRNCIEALGNLGGMPKFVSFEADLSVPRETESMLAMLERYGYRRFKMVNQATHSTRRMPNPPREGKYVDARFTKHSSGPFGEESPGSWLTRAEVTQLFHRTVKQQAVRIEYSARGSVAGIPMARIHRQLKWFYNTPAVTWVRVKYAGVRGIEAGGWFDIHAAL